MEPAMVRKLAWELLHLPEEIPRTIVQWQWSLNNTGVKPEVRLHWKAQGYLLQAPMESFGAGPSPEDALVAVASALWPLPEAPSLPLKDPNKFKICWWLLGEFMDGWSDGDSLQQIALTETEKGLGLRVFLRFVSSNLEGDLRDDLAAAGETVEDAMDRLLQQLDMLYAGEEVRVDRPVEEAIPLPANFMSAALLKLMDQ